MLKKIPRGWVKTTLGDIVSPSRRRAAPPYGFKTKYVGLEHIEAHTLRAIGYSAGDQIKSSASLFQSGDVLYGRMRPYLNKVWVAEFDGICSSEFLVFPQRPSLNTRFLAMRLAASDFVHYSDSEASGERPRVNFEKLAQFPIFLPPALEQDRIVEKLQFVFQSLDNAMAAAQRGQERLRKFRNAVLSDAVSGKLTEAWRSERRLQGPLEPAKSLLERIGAARRQDWEGAELTRLNAAGRAPKSDAWRNRYPLPASTRMGELPDLPDGWCWASLDQLGELNRGRSKHRPRGDSRLYDGPYPFIQTGDIRRSNGTIRQHTQTYSELGLAQSRLWPTGTLCITIAANIAETGLLTYPACFPDSVVGFQQRSDLFNVRFIEYFIRSKKAELENYAPATAQKNINLDLLANLAVPVPPVEEQNAIVLLAEQRLTLADQLAAKITLQMNRSAEARRLVLDDAFSGRLVAQDSNESSARALLNELKASKNDQAEAAFQAESFIPLAERARQPTMKPRVITPSLLRKTQRALGAELSAERLFKASGCGSDQVTEFYEALNATPELLSRLQGTGRRPSATVSTLTPRAARLKAQNGGRFRLVELWLQSFKNLQDYTATFDATHGLDVVMGWNGTGKSNLFEALVIIFRDLHDWWTRNRWPEEAPTGYKVAYEIDECLIRVLWDPSQGKRPTITRANWLADEQRFDSPATIDRTELPLPRFVFGYYSGPTNRLAEHFLPMNQAHYVRLRDATSDDPNTLANLLEQRRFFCAETHHAKYVLLAFCYQEDKEITDFLKSKLRIEGFESALFIVKKPRWAKSGTSAKDFWGATGVMRRVLERLRDFSLAPIVVEQTVNDGYRTAKEDHYYFFLPNLERLHAFAAEYENARTFFLALESTDFSELIHDVKVQVRIRSHNGNDIAITFKEMSEGEQQLLMVLGLMRFTKSFQSLVLLDEPDTHLNPHWSVEYLRLLANIMRDGPAASVEQQTSQILVSTHDPLVIAGLVKEQVHLMKRDKASGAYRWEQASVNPKGLGFTGILTSDMFGFRSDLDEATLADLDHKVRLMAKEGHLGPEEEKELEGIDQRLAEGGFQKAFSDPYYAAFVRAWGQRHEALMAGQQSLSSSDREEVERVAREVLEEAIAEVNKENSGDALR